MCCSPASPLPDPPFLQMLYRAGNEHEDETFAALFEGVEGAVVIEAEDLDAREWQTMQAVQSGALVIAGGRLPVDHESHRVGQPDLLVRHGGGYLPIEVKSHKALERVRKEGTGTALVSDVTTPFLNAGVIDIEHTARKHVGDLMQLAHYRALLDVAGIGSPESYAAGVCGSEGVIVWHDLAEANLPGARVCGGRSGRRHERAGPLRARVRPPARDPAGGRGPAEWRRRHRCWPSRSSATSATCAGGASGAVTGSRRLPT